MKKRILHATFLALALAAAPSVSHANEIGTRRTFGLGLVLGLVLCVIAYDAAGYLVGTRFGRTPLAPAISPGKTLEGLVITDPRKTESPATRP